MRIAFRLSYVGDRFAGSQIQPDRRTVEGEFIDACRRAGLFEDWREARFLAAGRTDRGVHARGQVVALDTDAPERAVAVLNRLLPPDLWCTGWAEVDPGFHPRHDAVDRTYRYYFLGEDVDTRAMSDAAHLFVGRHDFSRFGRPQDKSPIRTVHAADVGRDGEAWYVEVTADGFLWNMVRRMVHLLLEIGCGSADAEMITRCLTEPGDGVPAAPAAGLVLWRIAYDPDPAFVEMDRSERNLRYLDRLRRDLAIRKKVVDLLD